MTLFIKFVEHFETLKKQVLFLTKKVPFPAIDGECLVIKQDIQMCLDAACKVFVLSLNTDKHYVPSETIQQNLPSGIIFHSVEIDTRLKIWDAFKNLYSSVPYNIERFYHESFLELIKKTIAENHIDIIIFEGLHLALYASEIKTVFKKTCIMRSHNVESELWKRRSEQEKNVLKKWYLNTLFKKNLKYEIRTYTEIDLFIAISKRDLEKHLEMGLKGNNVVIPFSLNSIKEVRTTPKQHSIFFLGSFDWEPNYSGIRWFVKQVWTEFHINHPTWKLYLAGRNFPIKDVAFEQPGIEILGEVKDTAELFQTFEIMIVPLFSGSGIRIKIIEAMFAGNVIVSTAIGAEGIYNKNSSGILIAEDATQFLKILKRLANSESDKKELGIKNQIQATQEFLYESMLQRWKEALRL